MPFSYFKVFPSTAKYGTMIPGYYKISELTVTGSQTAVGSSQNYFSYELENYDGKYEIVPVYGRLTITQQTIDPDDPDPGDPDDPPDPIF